MTLDELKARLARYSQMELPVQYEIRMTLELETIAQLVQSGDIEDLEKSAVMFDYLVEHYGV